MSFTLKVLFSRENVKKMFPSLFALVVRINKITFLFILFLRFRAFFFFEHLCVFDFLFLIRVHLLKNFIKTRKSSLSVFHNP